MGDLLIGKGIYKAGKGKGINRAGEGVSRAGYGRPSSSALKNNIIKMKQDLMVFIIEIIYLNTVPLK